MNAFSDMKKLYGDKHGLDINIEIAFPSEISILSFLVQCQSSVVVVVAFLGDLVWEI